jgi:hypothetical protein
MLEEESQNPRDFLEGIVSHSGISERELVQIFCIYKFKYGLGIKYDREIDWEEGALEWASSTCAAKFSAEYSRRCNIHTIYERSTEGYNFTPIRT